MNCKGLCKGSRIRRGLFAPSQFKVISRPLPDEAAYSATPLLCLSMLKLVLRERKRCARYENRDKFMKKTLFFLGCLLATCICFAQKDSSSQSKAVEFMSKSSTLLQKEYHYLGKIQKYKGALYAKDTISFQVLFIKNVSSGKEIGCLRLITEYKGNYTNDTYIGTLDYEEIDDCLQSLTYAKNIIQLGIPEKYTEIVYITNDNLKLGVYGDFEGWKLFVYTKGYIDRSAIVLPPNKIDETINYLLMGKRLIENR